MKKKKLTDILKNNGKIIRPDYTLKYKGVIIDADTDIVFVNEDVQRSLDVARSDSIMKNYNENNKKIPSAFIDYDGSILVYDGQHTVAAEILKGFTKIRISCIPFPPGLSEQGKIRMMSEAFCEVNTANKKVSPYTLLKNKVTCNHVSSVKLWKAVEAAGCTPFNREDTTLTKRSTLRPGDITHITNLKNMFYDIFEAPEDAETPEDMVKLDEAATNLTCALAMFRYIWPKHPVDNSIMIALACMIKTNPKMVERHDSVEFDIKTLKSFITGTACEDPSVFYDTLAAIKFKALASRLANTKYKNVTASLCYFYTKCMNERGIAGRLYFPGVSYAAVS